MRVFLGLLVAILTSTLALADGGRRYNSDNEFDGTYSEDSNGRIRLYDERGAFEGTVVPDDSGYRSYDWRNKYIGSATEDETGDE